MIPVNVDIPDPRAVLPIDIVSEMIRRDAEIIGVAACYCRRTKRLLNEGCDHPLQTCLVFNKGAETLIEHGTASPSRYRVALTAERYELCQACVDVCPTGARAVNGGRMVIDDDRCLGCGLCVTACPQAANRMILREVQAKMPATSEALYSKIGREALVGIAKQRITGIFRRS